MNFYKWLWSHTPINRPFTYWLRDLWHRFEFIWIIALVAIGVALGHNFNWIEVLKIMGIFTLGFIFGHLFWGTRYIESQGGV